jgi:hypothetical protein
MRRLRILVDRRLRQKDNVSPAEEVFVKRFPRPRRTPSNLSDSVHLRLNMYALAASAAGVGALALVQPSEAEIVYTPAHVTIGINKTIPLDLNHDGKTDFSFKNRTDTFEGSGQGLLSVVPAQRPNGVWGFGTSLFRRPYAYALPAGNQVGPKAPFLSRSFVYMLYANATMGCHGSWNDVKNRYLGLRFNIKQKTHYGWARLNISCNPKNRRITAVLTGYAYETIPNKPIVTGKTKGPDDVSNNKQLSPAALRPPAHQPASLGLLAMGAPALSIWRREEFAGFAQ